ncbi:hypothetical protein MC885_006560 [Smutsia gigantea]|nr:hypothetical protein MC885_006560 [Smutsia gigantea]
MASVPHRASHGAWKDLGVQLHGSPAGPQPRACCGQASAVSHKGVCVAEKGIPAHPWFLTSCVMFGRQAEVMDIDAEREKITKEIKELERILDPSSSNIHVDVSESSLNSDSDADSLCDDDSDVAGPPASEEERWSEASSDDTSKEKTLPEDPETCLQLNMVYQEVIQEKLAEVILLLAQNREQQEEITWDLAGSKGPRVKDGKSLLPNLYIGHFMKPYFKDRVTGVGPPANEDTREKASQGIKAFEELLVTKWKSWEKALLKKAVVSDRLQRLLQPKLLKLEYLRQKQSRVLSEMERQVLEKQTQEAEKEVQDISQLSEEALLGDRLDSHDWEKISNVNFEGGRSAEEVRKFWQNCEHPSINKQEWGVQEVDRLKAVAAEHGHLGWREIAEELGTGRSAFQCLQKFQQHNKALKRTVWTEEEDRMLSQLVQEMRVGSHIPYRRIVYYMEGRDSMQLIYRWTKSLDPSLKKGFWAPEEDAKLLQAVAKYGEQDWFKIREEVPGRSDAQCRDRRLHFSLKKGRWNSKEEEKLIELIEKYGVGHWAKIASELPHRTGSQCLSKWKIMARKRQRGQRRRRGRRLPRSLRWSSSSEDSSSLESSEDSEPEPEEAPQAMEGSPTLLSAWHAVPDMDLWVPARQGTSELWGGGAGGWPAHPAASPGSPEGADVAHSGNGEACAMASAAAKEAGWAQGLSRTQSTGLMGSSHLCLADTRLTSSEGPADKSGRCLLKVPLETTPQVLRTNTAASCQMLKEKPRQRHLLSPLLGAGPSGSGVARPHVQQPWRRTIRRRQQRQGHTLQRRLLQRRLLMAVSLWVGDDVLPCTSPKPAVVHTRADGLRQQLQDAHLTSTPVFALFIQLFQIDAAGCMEVVRERKALSPSGLQAGTGDPPPQPLQVREAHEGLCSVLPAACPSQSGPTRGAAGRSASLQGRAVLPDCRAASTPQAPLPAPRGPRPKPKTVSELLREKRAREARARKATQGPVALPPQLLASRPAILQRAPAPASQPATLQRAPALASRGPPAADPAALSALPGSVAPAAAHASTSGSWVSVEDKPALDLALSCTEAAPAASRAQALSPGQVPVSCPLSSPGQSQAPATWRQGLPEAPPLLLAAPSPTQWPVQPCSLTPTLAMHSGGPPVVASAPLPVTWVLTAPGLLPVPLPAMVGLPEPAGIPGPRGLFVTLPTFLTEMQAAQGPGQPPASSDTESDPPSVTDLPTFPAVGSHQSTAEVGGNMAHVPRGVPSPGAARVPRPSPPATPLANHSEAEPPGSSQPPLQGGSALGGIPWGTPGCPSQAGESRESLGPERPLPPQPGPEKGALNLALLSPESEAAVREWLRGQRGVCVPRLGSRLPYQPPTLCSLRALSGLLLHKKALERRAASLIPDGATGALQASLEQVWGQLQDSPAYLLLKARFLAAFALPALLATLPPHGVPTTLSAARQLDSESDDDDWEGLELADSNRQPGHWATTPVQGALDPGEGSGPCLDSPDDLDVLRTRHSQHTRKRRRLLPPGLWFFPPAAPLPSTLLCLPLSAPFIPLLSGQLLSRPPPNSFLKQQHCPGVRLS